MSAPTARSARARWVLVVLALGLLTAAVSTPTWVRAPGRTALGGSVMIDIGGTQAAPEVLAAALAVLAAGAALALVGRSGRWAVVVVLVGCAVIVGAGVARVLGDPTGVVRPLVASRTGLTAMSGPASTTLWPWLAGGLALVMLAAAVTVGAARSRWPARDRRHDRPGPADERSDWDALSRGLDPTADGADPADDGADPTDERDEPRAEPLG